MKTELIVDRDGLSRLGAKLAENSEVSLDFESTSDFLIKDAPLHHDKLKPVGFGFGFPDKSAAYVPVAHGSGKNAPIDESFSLLRKVASDKDKKVWAWNAKYELKVLHSLGMELEGNIRDGMLIQWLLSKGVLGGRVFKLKPTVKSYLKYDMATWEETVPKGFRAHQISSDKMGPYCGDDCRQVLLLKDLWFPEMEELGLVKVFEDLECPFIHVLTHMEEMGIEIDKEFLREFQDTLLKEIDEVKNKFYDLVGVDIASSQQVSKAMYDELKWWPSKGIKQGKSGVFSVDADSRDIVRDKLESDSKGMLAMELKDRHAEISKLYSTYTYTLIDASKEYLDGRVRAEFKQHGTVTGRLAVTSPPLQTIPNKTDLGRQLRKAFISKLPWKMGGADYSQMELRMMAHLSRDKMLTKAYVDDIDVHQQTADFCSVGRPKGKVTNLGLIYEMSDKTLAKNVNCSEAQGTVIYSRWHQLYAAVKPYCKSQHLLARKRGYVKTLTGRIRYIEDINSKKYGIKSRAEREASNTPCQGSSADVIKIAMRNLYREWKSRGVLYNYWTKQGKAKIMLQVHDEIICEMHRDFAEEGAADMKRHMENAVKLRVPLKAKPVLAQCWYDAKD